MNKTIAVEEEIGRQIDHIRDIMNLAGQAVAVLPGRQILQIRTARYFTAGYRPHDLAGPTSLAYVVFQGDPSPSSEVTGGVIRFVDTEEVRAPTYDPTAKTIQLWIDHAYLVMVLEQLKHRKHFLWIGFFDNGHTYGDLHSDP